MSRTTLTLVSIAAALSISGCATGGHGHGRGHGEAHMSRMCEMHKQMTAGKSADEQRSAIESHIKSMHGSATPEKVAHHQKMMEMHC